ncbi:hypothetical protein [Pseudomonas sp. DC3000-4b1]|uniref:hypothetical protein n=1 Tax=unclassified Pseudomonas TaxID=196821 RepID=UPI003CF3B121
MIPDQIIEQVTTDPVEGVLRLISYARDQMGEEQGFADDEYEVLLEAFALVSSLREADMIYIDVYEPELNGNRHESCLKILDYLHLVGDQLHAQASELRLKSLKQKFTAAITNGFGYEFTEGDLSRLQALINELRAHLQADTKLDDGHKRRLLKRLEALQRELHKKVSDVSNFYALLGDAGVAIGKLGTDAKPIVDRIREIAQIGWKAQARAEELPGSADNPLLGHDNELPKLES